MKEQIDILVKKGTVVTMNREREIIKDGAVGTKGNIIIDVGKTEALEQKYEANTTVGANGKLVLPGLVDAHVHTCQEFPRGLADDVDSLTWLSRIVPFEANMTEKDAYWSALLSCLEMIKTGTTTFCEAGATPPFVNQVAQAIKESGLRAILTRSTMDIKDPDSPIPEFFIESAQKAVKENIRMIDKWHGEAKGRINAGLMFRHTCHLSPKLGKEMFSIARRYQITISGHVSFALKYIEKTKERFGCSEVEYLNKLGGLGGNLLIAHAVYLSEKDIELLQKNKVNVVHCPAGSMHGAYGAASVGRFPEMVERGINIALGCDSAANNNNLDMIEELKFAALIHKEMRINPSVMAAEKVVEMATLNGAKALLLKDEIGSIEPGKKADLILLDLKKPHLVPTHDFISNLVYSANGGDIDTVIIDGELIMKEKRVTTLNEMEIMEEAQKRAESIKRRTGIKISPQWKVV